MRIYDAARHQKYEEVLRSLGALLDQRAMSEISVNQTHEGFMVQGLALVPGEERAWNDPNARRDKETLQLREDDLLRFMDEALTRREGRSARAQGPQFAATQAAG